MTRLQIEIDNFVAAANITYNHIAEPVRIAAGRLAVTLEGCAGMAGDDEGGAGWAAAYDDAARAMATATNRFAAAAFTTTSIFGRAGMNYSEAEAACNPASSMQTPIAQRLPPDSLLGPARTPPSAVGAGGDEPTGWGLIKHFVGYVWPNGHQDRLRRAAAGYQDCADALESAAQRPGVIMMRFLCDQLPELEDVNAVCLDLGHRATHLADSNRKLARACEALAHHIDACHSQVISELTELLAESAAVETVGFIASVVTFGAAEVATQEVEAIRIRTAAARITVIIQRFIEGVRTLHAAMPALTAAVETDIVALDRIADIQAVVADVRHAGSTSKVHISGTAGTAPAAQVGAQHMLQAGTTVRIKRPLTAAERKHVLDGDKNGGGHRYPGKPGKELFPLDWSDAKIIEHIQGIVCDDSTAWHVETGNGGLYTKAEEPSKWRAWEVRDGVRIRVIWMPATGRVVTAFPDPDGAVKGKPVP